MSEYELTSTGVITAEEVLSMATTVRDFANIEFMTNEENIMLLRSLILKIYEDLNARIDSLLSKVGK